MTLSSAMRPGKTLLSLSVLAVGFGVGAVSPARAQFSFFSSQAAWNSAVSNITQTSLVFNAPSDVTLGNPVIGTQFNAKTHTLSNRWDVASMSAGGTGMLHAGNYKGGAYFVSATNNNVVSDFELAGTGVNTTAAGVIFSVNTMKTGSASIFVNNHLYDSDFIFTKFGNDYVGIAGAGIHSVEIVSNGSAKFGTIGNIGMANPVPEFGSLMGLGGLLVAGGFAGLRRRQG